MMTKYKTVKRKANVGERILITDAECGQRYYRNGDIATVSDKEAWVSSLLYVNEWEHSVHEFEYEVIVDSPKPTKNERITALETEVAELKAKVEALEKAKTTTVHNVTFNTHQPSDARKVAEAIRKAMDVEFSPKPRSLTPNERRADVIKRAKAFVSAIVGNNGSFKIGIGGYPNQKVRASFHVNTEKRAVTVLIHGHFTGKLRGKGIAKCDPSDVFNADIGKAIALGRALGVDVSEFEQAVQPTEVVVGMSAEVEGNAFPYVDTVIDGRGRLHSVQFLRKNPKRVRKIIGDTDAVYE